MCKKWLLLPLCVVCMLFGATAHADIVTDSAVFDKAYIPALAVTSQNDAEKTKAAMARLHPSWLTFSNAYRQHKPSDDAWKSGFSEIDNWIAKADDIVARGSNLTEAHDALEPVRVILMQLRRKNGIDYFVDYQTAFHEPMEAIVLTAKGKTPETLTQQDIDKIRSLMPTLNARWSALQNAKFSPELFAFDNARVTQVNQSMESETNAIAALKRALADSDKSAIIQRASAIKPPFAQMFMLFGEFAK
jgi:DNA-binding protein